MCPYRYLRMLECVWLGYCLQKYLIDSLFIFVLIVKELNNEAHMIILKHLDSFVASCLF